MRMIPSDDAVRDMNHDLNSGLGVVALGWPGLGGLGNLRMATVEAGYLEMEYS